MSAALLDDLRRAFAEKAVVPYLGPGLLAAAPYPLSFDDLGEALAKRVAVPGKLRRNGPGAAQYIESFKHRKTLVAQMGDVFGAIPAPVALHRLLAGRGLPLLVSAWYDGTLGHALEESGAPWGRVQGVSRAEHRDQWVKYYGADGAEVDEGAADWPTLLYEPLGGRPPANNYLVSDADFVEVLTEIDIQSPIPPRVQRLRASRRFLFVGCRFRNQLERTYARQVMKRSSPGPHWAVLDGELSRNEARFLEEQNIQRLDLTPEALAELLAV